MPAFIYLDKICDLATLFDTCGLTTTLTQIEDLGTTNDTTLGNFDAFDVGRADRENTLYANGTGHLTNGEGCVGTGATTLDNDAFVQLDALFIAFLDSDTYFNGITRLKFGVVIATVGCLYKVNQIFHFMQMI